MTGNITIPIIDLGLHGHADSFFNSDMVDEALDSLPLICRLDLESGLIQLEKITDANDRYNFLDYSYTSANSTTSRNHWNQLVESIHCRKSLTGKNLLEVGSNDGYLLSQALKYTKNVVGIDASAYMSEVANSKGIPTIQGIFGETEEIENQLNDKYLKYDFIVANNVLNHSNSPTSFLNLVKKYLNSDGLFVFEVPYWLNTIKSLRFDQIYHEHITYFTVESVEHMLKMSGLYIYDIEVVDYHGGSMRVYANQKETNSPAKVTLLHEELKYNLKEPTTYENYMGKIKKNRNAFMEKVDVEKHKGISTVFGVGAAAKANTFLTYYGFNSDTMKFVLDSSKYKQGKITPVTRIPIVGDEAVVDIKDGLGILLAWNIGSDLKSKLLSMNSNLNFLDSL